MSSGGAHGIVIVGAGAAAVQAAEALRSGGFAGPITMIGDEAHAPYHRPPLSKAWLAGEMDAAQLQMRSAEVLARKNITLRTGTRAVRLHRDDRTVELADGSRLPYDGLVLATGSRPRMLALPGAEAAGVHALRGRDDASAIAASLARCQSRGEPLVVIGGGFIGLEIAATARKKGIAVTVVEAAPRLLARALGPALSAWFADLHRGHGVDLRLDARPDAFEADADGHVAALRLAGGERLPAGAVVVGIGVLPEDGLARDAGLACDRGIVVDACARTADPAIVAAGDCTAQQRPDGQVWRLESVNNATEQGKSAAAALLGQERPFAGTPWFWSDQYDRKLQMAGLAQDADRSVLRGSMDDAAFSVWHYRQGRLVGVDTVNLAREHLLARKLLDAGRTPDPAQVADRQTDPAAWPLS